MVLVAHSRKTSIPSSMDVKLKNLSLVDQLKVHVEALAFMVSLSPMDCINFGNRGGAIGLPSAFMRF